MKAISYFFLILSVFWTVDGRNFQSSNLDGGLNLEHLMHPRQTTGHSNNISPRRPDLLKGSEYYLNKAKKFVEEQVKKRANKNVAKNVVLFLGDGMSVATLAAARMYLGGEEKSLSFETFPYLGMSKTYCVDKQVPDSACTATAYLSGVKGNYGTIGVTAKVKRHDCSAGMDRATHTVSIAKHALDAGKSIGLVTTTRVTHASPAGVYAHTADRDWESNIDVIKSKCNDTLVDDIAEQLVLGEVGSQLKVIFGGGRQEFRDESMVDELGHTGRRTDKRDLIQTWLERKPSNEKRTYIWNKEGLKNISSENTDAVLGLFDTSHCKFNYEIDGISDTIPTLSEMTLKAIEILSKNPKGFFLFVEGGKIDIAHHSTMAHIALDETVQFSKAIDQAQMVLNDDDTLTVVTSDHAHTMTYAGYGNRGSNIFGTGGRSDKDEVPYLKLSYANGHGFYAHTMPTRLGRVDPTDMELQKFDFEFPGTLPLASETHGGDDVAIFAEGPFAHLFQGVLEQHCIPHIMAFAACIGDGQKACH